MGVSHTMPTSGIYQEHTLSDNQSIIALCVRDNYYVHTQTNTAKCITLLRIHAQSKLK